MQQAPGSGLLSQIEWDSQVSGWMVGHAEVIGAPSAPSLSTRSSEAWIVAQALSFFHGGFIRVQRGTQIKQHYERSENPKLESPASN